MASDLRSTLVPLLRNSTSEKIQACLIKSLVTASPKQLEELSALLTPLSSQASVPKHCVRCHDEYYENENHRTACKIEHHEDGECEQTVVGYEEMTMTVSCCGFSFDAYDGPGNSVCISKFHTTRSYAVKYYDEDEDDGDHRVNKNVITCLKAGCSEFEEEKRKQANEGGTSRASKKRK